MSNFWSQLILLLVRTLLKEKLNKDVVVLDDSSEVRKDS